MRERPLYSHSTPFILQFSFHHVLYSLMLSESGRDKTEKLKTQQSAAEERENWEETQEWGQQKREKIEFSR